MLPINDSCTANRTEFVPVGGDQKYGRTSSPPYVTNLPYYRRVWSRQLGLIQFETGQTGSALTCLGGISYIVNDDPNWQTVLTNRLAKAVRGHSFNPGVSIGELNESCGMIGSAARGLAKGAVKLEKDMTKAIRGSNRVSNALKRAKVESLWLQAVYGWLPLIGDIDSAMEFLGFALNRPRRQTYRANYKCSVDGVSSSPTNYTVSGKGFRRYYAVAHVRESDVRGLAYTGLIDVASIAWELTPYSFVADWFIPIGDFLSARNFLNTVEADICYGYVERFAGTSQAAPGTIYKQLVPQVFRVVEHSRSVGALPLPLPSFRPLSQVASNWRHAVDGIALAEGRFRALSRFFT